MYQIDIFSFDRRRYFQYFYFISSERPEQIYSYFSEDSKNIEITRCILTHRHTPPDQIHRFVFLMISVNSAFSIVWFLLKLELVVNTKNYIK